MGEQKTETPAKKPEPNMLDRAAILEATTLPTRRLAVPEWGGMVLVKTLTAKERDWYEVTVQRRKFRNARALLVMMSCIDDKGETLFTERDIEKLGELSSRALNLVFETARRMSGIGPQDIEDLEGN